MTHKTIFIISAIVISIVLLFALGRRGASQENTSAVEGSIEASIDGSKNDTQGIDPVVIKKTEVTTDEPTTREIPTIEEIMAKDFTLPRYGGGEIALSSYRGDKPVILDFWTTWCHNCRRDMPVQDALYKKYKDDVEVIAINMNEKRSVVDAYLKKNDFSLPIVYDDGSVADDYALRYTNTHVLVNTDGTVYDIFPGDIEEEHFQALIKNNQ